MQAVPVSVSVSLPGIDSSVYDFRALSAGNYLPGDEQSFSGSGAEISGAGAAANPENIGTVEPEAEPEPEPELGGYMVGPSNHVRQRTQFTRRDDVLLLQVVLANSQLLAHDFKSKSRRVFWHRICSELAAGFGVLKNKRQCRDRFKLLFHRAISQNQFEQRNAGAANALTNSSPDTELDKLLSACFNTFCFTETKEIALVPGAALPPTAPPTAPSYAESAIYTPRSLGELCEKSTPVATLDYPPVSHIPIQTPVQTPAPAAAPALSWESRTIMANIMSMQSQIDHLTAQIETLVQAVNLSHKQPQLYQPMYTGDMLRP